MIEGGLVLIVLAVIFASRRISRKIPGALIAVIGAIAASWALDLGATVPILGAVPGGLPHIGLPDVDWSWELVKELAPIIGGRGGGSPTIAQCGGNNPSAWPELVTELEKRIAE